MVVTMANSAIEEQRASDLVRAAIEDTRALVQAEVALAKSELATEARAVTLSLAALLFSVILCGLGAAGLVVALLLFTGASTALVILLSSVTLVLIAAVLGVVARRPVPEGFLNRTRARLGSDVRELKERLQ